jgi:hypothetical protein
LRHTHTSCRHHAWRQQRSVAFVGHTVALSEDRMLPPSVTRLASTLYRRGRVAPPWLGWSIWWRTCRPDRRPRSKRAPER